MRPFFIVLSLAACLTFGEIQPILAGGPYGGCSILTTVPREESGSCSCSDTPLSSAPNCSGGVYIIQEYMKCASAPTGTSGKTICTSQSRPVGKFFSCHVEWLPDKILECALKATGCALMCGTCATTGEQCNACMSCLQGEVGCGPCDLAQCAADYGEDNPIRRNVGTLGGDDCVGT
jgi:hypothetical protein